MYDDRNRQYELFSLIVLGSIPELSICVFFLNHSFSFGYNRRRGSSEEQIFQSYM